MDSGFSRAVPFRTPQTRPPSRSGRANVIRMPVDLQAEPNGFGPDHQASFRLHPTRTPSVHNNIQLLPHLRNDLQSRHNHVSDLLRRSQFFQCNNQIFRLCNLEEQDNRGCDGNDLKR